MGRDLGLLSPPLRSIKIQQKARLRRQKFEYRAFSHTKSTNHNTFCNYIHVT